MIVCFLMYCLYILFFQGLVCLLTQKHDAMAKVPLCCNNLQGETGQLREQVRALQVQLRAEREKRRELETRMLSISTSLDGDQLEDTGLLECFITFSVLQWHTVLHCITSLNVSNAMVSRPVFSVVSSIYQVPTLSSCRVVK